MPRRVIRTSLRPVPLLETPAASVRRVGVSAVLEGGGRGSEGPGDVPCPRGSGRRRL